MSDAYEDGFMGGTRARYHEKHVSRGFAMLMGGFALFAAAIGVSILFTPAWPGAFGAFFAAGVVGLTTLYFSAMRTTVTATELTVQYGTLGPRVPLEAIESAELATLGALERIAFGPKYRGSDGWSYISPGQTHGVRVRWRDGAKVRQILVGAENAAALLRAIEEGRAAGTRRAPAMRVADPDAADENEARATDGEERSATGAARRASSPR